jgi:hypothetical protein
MIGCWPIIAVALPIRCARKTVIGSIPLVIGKTPIKN